MSITSLSMNLLRRPALAIAVFCLIASVISADCQDRKGPIVQANREIGVSFAPSIIAYREYGNNGTEQDSEHGWIAGVGARAAILFPVFGRDWLSETTYQYDDGTSKHWSLSGTGSGTLQYQAPFRSNDWFVAVGPTFTPTLRLSWMLEADTRYRQWRRGLPKAEYEIVENYTFWAPGAGVMANYNPVGRLVLRARGGLAHTVFPTNAGIGNPATQVPDVTFSLGTRNIWQADLGTDYPISHGIQASAGIGYSHFGFGKSNSEPGGPEHGPQYEPNSITDLAKINVGVAWAF
jgi:hypothetical protein